MAEPHLLVFGLGYTGAAIARAARDAGFAVTGTKRSPAPVEGLDVVPFDAVALHGITHVVATAAPDSGQDPVLARHGAALAALPSLRWAGYLSSTGVYGDRDGGWVDETTPPAPGSARTRARLAAERAWAARLPHLPVDIFRVAGIYGPGRSALDEIRGGTARRVIKAGHMFGRIHRDDIAAAVLAAMRQTRPPGPRVLNLADDLPAPRAEVLAEAARLLGQPPPPDIPFAEALAGMSPMAAGFWAENRRVASAATQSALGLRWRYPTYREGLAAILAGEITSTPAAPSPAK